MGKRSLGPAACALLALSLTACGNESRLPTGSLPDDPPEGPGGAPSAPSSHILGSFSLTILLTYTDLDSAERRTAVCPGSVRIPELEGASFAGSFGIEPSAECVRGESGAVAGRVLPLGDLTFDLHVAGFEANELPNLTGCVYSGQPSGFDGAINAKRFVATSTAAVSCAVAGGSVRSFELRIRIAGERLP